MQETLVAYAGDCVVRGDVELGDGRLSDEVNGRELLMFRTATLEALDDGHQVAMDELEVERRDLHVIEVNGRRGDPSRRMRTVEERVVLEIGPFIVIGNLHRAPHTQALAALASWSKFVPVTDAVFQMGRDAPQRHQDVLLVNRDRISKSRPVGDGSPGPGIPWDRATTS